LFNPTQCTTHMHTINTNPYTQYFGADKLTQYLILFVTELPV